MHKMNRHRITTVAALALLSFAVAPDLFAQRRGGGSRPSGGGGYSGSSVRQSRGSYNSSRPQPQASGQARPQPSQTQRQPSQTQTTPPQATPEQRAQAQQGAQSRSTQPSTRGAEVDSVGESTVVRGEQGAAVIGEQGAVAVGEQGAAAYNRESGNWAAAGEQGVAAGSVGEGAVAVGEEGFAVAHEGEVSGAEWGNNWDDEWEGGVYWDEDDVFEDVEAWHVAAGVAVGIAIGVTIASLPPTYTTVYVAGSPYYYYDNVFYAPAYSGTTVVYEVIAPPPGAVITTLPAGCATRMVNGVNHWVCGNTAYIKAASGYKVVVLP